jgi:hypothetical protein
LHFLSKGFIFFPLKEQRVYILVSSPSIEEKRTPKFFTWFLRICCCCWPIPTICSLGKKTSDIKVCRNRTSRHCLCITIIAR